MKTTSTARAIECAKGWRAEFHLACDREPHVLCDEQGRPCTYVTAEKAMIAAQSALVAAMERVDAEYIEPSLRRLERRPWETIRSPKSRAGRKALFNSIFQQTKQGERA